MILALVLPGCSEPGTFALTIEVDPSDGGTATFTGTSPFASGASVAVPATANVGFEFAGWPATAGYCDDPLAPSTNYNMPEEAATITASFGQAVFATGAMIGELVFSEEKSPTATVTKIAAGSVDLYLQPGIVAADVYEAILDAGLPHEVSYGSFRDIRYNPVGPLFGPDDELNPFSVIEIREAMNWLYDRDYVVEEYLGGLGEPIYALGGRTFLESSVRYPTVVQAIEDYYAVKTPAEVLTIITPYMEGLNCTWNVGEELWYYDGSPVELKMLIRSDLSPYPAAGDYVSDQLEAIGFTTVRDYKTSGEAVWIWLFGDPADGEWHVYTGGWGIPTIPRDQAETFAGQNTASWYSVPLYLAYEAQCETWDDGWTGGDYDYAGGYYDLITDLFARDFSSMTEREEMFEQAMWGMAKFAGANLLADMAGATPYGFNVDLLVNKAYGPGEGWTNALHFHGAGVPVWRDQMQIEMESIMVNPWNPVDGSNWVYDLTLNRDAMQENGLLQDPVTGLYHPRRIESAEVTIANNLPVTFEGTPPDWIDLTILGEGEFITIPDDAWAVWNATTESWMTAAEVYGAGMGTCVRKSVEVYPADIFDFPMHDGSTLSVADFLMNRLVEFDIAQADSPIYEEAREYRYSAIMSSFRGIRYVSADPLTIEYYSDSWYMDPSWNIIDEFPEWKQGGSNPWHMIGIGWLAARDGVLEFGSDAAEETGQPWMDYTKGDSLPILEGYLADVQDSGHADYRFIPYETAIQDAYTALGLGSLTTEIDERYANLQAWYDAQGHFWVDMGLYYLDEVFPVEKVIVMKRFEAHPDPSDRWLFLLD
jgi:peptide/nickel transport system substrate-binding protein